jgi:hypothetical protein
MRAVAAAMLALPAKVSQDGLRKPSRSRRKLQAIALVRILPGCHPPRNGDLPSEPTAGLGALIPLQEVLKRWWYHRPIRAVVEELAGDVLARVPPPALRRC